MDSELIDLLRRYLAGFASREDINLLVSGFDIWNAWQDADAEILALRDIAGELELLLSDVAEGFRDEEELRWAAARAAFGYARTYQQDWAESDPKLDVATASGNITVPMSRIAFGVTVPGSSVSWSVDTLRETASV